MPPPRKDDKLGIFYRVIKKSYIYHALADGFKQNKCCFFKNKQRQKPPYNSHLTLLSPRRQAAFTLAEVLITIGIIGIVASLTIPRLITNIENKRNVTVLKRAYSDLHNYVKAFDYENNCNGNLTNCAPNAGEFVYKFADFLENKQKFKDGAYPDKDATFIKAKGINNSTEGFSTRVTDTSRYLISPNSSYAYFITVYMYDNFYTNIKREQFRARIFIITNVNQKYLNPTFLTYSGQNVVPLEIGKNIFEAYVTQLTRVIPNGSPLCRVDGYYCRPLQENSCKKGSNSYTQCFQKIIDDNWEIKY